MVEGIGRFVMSDGNSYRERMARLVQDRDDCRSREGRREYQRQFEGEPPMSARERDEMQAKRDARWGVK